MYRNLSLIEGHGVCGNVLFTLLLNCVDIDTAASPTLTETQHVPQQPACNFRALPPSPSPPSLPPSLPVQAALLHDTVEDTDTRPEELEAAFGPEVRALVAEVSDDKSLPKEERKRLQVSSWLDSLQSMIQ